MTTKLTEKKCVPCEHWIPPLKGEKIKQYLSQLKLAWEVVEEKKIKHKFKFKGFSEAMDFINKVAKITEKENHHPNICIYYNKVNITLWTHFISGLHENDFILAAKLENLL